MYLFCDLETTGFNYKWCDILEIGALLTTDKLQIIGEFNQFSAPESKKYWSVDAEKIHGISYKRAIGFQKPKVTNDNFRDFLRPFKDENIKFVYHGIRNFDYLFLWWSNLRNGSHFEIQNFLKEENIISTITISKRVQHITGLQNNKLKTLCDYFKINFNHHHALDDAKATFLLYNELMHITQTTMEKDTQNGKLI